MRVTLVARRSWGGWPLVVALLGALAVGCDRGEPPPTNPLDESRVTATAAPLPTGPVVFPPAPGGSPTAVATPGASPSATPTPDLAAEAAREKAAARAIEAIASWLGVPQTEFSLVLVETVAWRDACLGVTRPDVMCAQVVTPGERVTLRHRSGISYQVHLGPREAAWPPVFESTRTVASVDLASGMVTLQAIAGNDELGTRHRTVPGSAARVLKDLKAGDRVRIAAVSWPERNAGYSAIVWIDRAP